MLVENGTLTVGDALAGSLSRSLQRLPDKDQAERAERTLDAMLAAGSAELDSISEDLDRELSGSAANVTRVSFLSGESCFTIAESRARSIPIRRTSVCAEVQYLKDINEKAKKIDSYLRPSRDATRRYLAELLAAQEAQREAQRRTEARLSGFGRAASWRGTAPPSRSGAATPPPLVVRVCEASALAISLLLLAGAADLLSSSTPPQLATVRLQQPRRTADYTNLAAGYSSSGSDGSLGSSLDEVLFGEPEGGGPSTFEPPAVRRPAPSAEAVASRALWWQAMRTALFVYLASLGVILVRSNTDEWAALASASRLPRAAGHRRVPHRGV
jgi:hypothetical protein